MYKVLLVDDEAYMLKGLRSILNWEEHGLEIAEVALNGLTALEIIKNKKINILITDIKMPKMNGLELIRYVKEFNSDIKIIILSGYDDFEYIKEAAKIGIENYLLKPVNEEELSLTLISTVQKIEDELGKKIKSRKDSNILNENILNRWITNTISPIEFMERAAFLNIGLDYGTFTVSLLRPINIENSTPIWEPDLLRFSLINICSETIALWGKSEVFQSLDGDIVLIFYGNCIKDSRSEISRLLTNCINNIKQSISIDTIVTIGSTEDDYPTVHTSYRNAKLLMDYSLIMEPNTIIDFDEKQKSYIKLEKTFDIKSDKLNNLIISQKNEEVMSFIDDIFTRLSNDCCVTSIHFQNVSIEILNILVKAARTKNIDIYSFISPAGNPFARVFQVESKDMLIALLKQTINMVMDNIKSDTHQINPLIERVFSYVNTNYDKDISLKLLSTAFNANAAYLGQLFKNETGEMFSNFLNRVRIEKAKELLTNKKLTANEIAAKVGYSNISYFYSAFKKLTGKYPTEYRRESSL